ncbi:MAG: DNA cytosine methyltransferase, partial [Sulfurimonas sp.]
MVNGELIIDLFAGGGGASTGIEMALGVPPDIAVNHDPEAIALHEANHPYTKHFIEDIFEVNPVDVCGLIPVGLMWMSPDCKHFSKAKGSKPVSCDIRSLAWVGIKWAKAVKPRIIMLENVEEFQDWCPIGEDNRPILSKKGETFELFVQAFKDLGYQVDWKEMRASDYGAPTIRKRLFLIARCDGEPIVFPTPTHGDPKKYPNRLPWATAAQCIDWSIPTHSIFLSKEEGKKVGVRRPLVEKTMERIAEGMRKFVLDNPEPFIVKNMYNNTPKFVSEPMATLLTGNHHYLTVPYVSTYYGSSAEQKPRGNVMDAPVGTITAGGLRHALVAPFVTEHANGSSQRNMPLDEPLRTVCANVKGGHFALVAIGHKPDKPIS